MTKKKSLMIQLYVYSSAIRLHCLELYDTGASNYMYFSISKNLNIATFIQDYQDLLRGNCRSVDPGLKKLGRPGSYSVTYGKKNVYQLYSTSFSAQ